MNEAELTLWRIMWIEEGNTLRDPHNSSYDTNAEFNDCFIIHSKYSETSIERTPSGPFQVSA